MLMGEQEMIHHITLQSILVLQTQILMSVNVEFVHTIVLTLLVLLYALVEKDSTSLLMAGLVLVDTAVNNCACFMTGHMWVCSYFALFVKRVNCLLQFKLCWFPTDFRCSEGS